MQLGQRLTGVMARCALYQGFSEDLTAESRRTRLFHTCGLQATTPRSYQTESMLALISKQLWNRLHAVHTQDENDAGVETTVSAQNHGTSIDPASQRVS